MFKDYRIPRVNLLNRTADVTPEGQYESSFSDPGRILGAALENLSAGRVAIMQESSNNIICAVTIALRYAALRKQFGPNGNDGKDEWPLIEYQLHVSHYSVKQHRKVILSFAEMALVSLHGCRDNSTYFCAQSVRFLFICRRVVHYF